MQIPAEFRLTAACCAWPPSPERAEAVRRAALGIDWVRFVATVRRHRVEGLVAAALADAGVVPGPPAEAELARAGRSTARDNLLLAAEAARVGKAFDEAGISYLVLKGAPLAMLAYGTLALKRAADIDMAVDPLDYPEAIRLLRGLGFDCELPGRGASDPEILAAAMSNKHSIWLRGGVALELHSAIVDTPTLLPGVSVRSPRQEIAIGPGLSLPTLARDTLFAYLCVHGATHAWSRLKWLADVAALLSKEDPDGIEKLYRRARELGAGRSAAQALLLCRDLLGTAMPVTLHRELRRSHANRFLARTALGAMLAGGGVAELDERALGTAPIHLSHFLLVPGWRFKAGELRRKLRTGGAPGQSRLAQRLLAAPRWLARRARTARARRA